MDSILQLQENGDEMYQFISKQKEEMGKETVDAMMAAGAFSIERMEAMGVADKLDNQQKKRMKEYQSKQKRYEKELQKLGKRNTAEGMAAYFEIMIQLEQNAMEMRLFKASVLGEGAVAQRIKIESLDKINGYRQVVLNYYNTLVGQGKQAERRDQLAEELAKGKKAHREAAVVFNLSVLTAAALDKVQDERQQRGSAETEDSQKLLEEFLTAEYAKKTLETDYVIQNLYTCLHNVELIRRIRRMKYDGDDADKVAQKLEAVDEYVNVVESVLWEYGLRIDFATLQIREIHENDENFAKRRQAYEANGALRYYLGVRKYKQTQKKKQEPPEEEQQIPLEEEQQALQKTRVEESLSAMEANLKLSFARGNDMGIMISSTRSFGQLGRAKAGDVIKASTTEAQGKMKHVQVKMRLFNIFNVFKSRLMKLPGNGGQAFQELQNLMEDYVYTNRDIYTDRTAEEEKEANALRVLKKALVIIKTGIKSRGSRYAAILLGMLTDENNGYLEVPSGERHFVEDSKLILGDKRKPGKAAERTYKDCTHLPLFTHRPNIKDIAQGGLGDCYLLAGLISVVDQNAEEIMNIMRDNRDGTVTVCFKQEEQDATGKMIYTPCYVTVKKTIPINKAAAADITKNADAFSRGALWVKMMEKAYAASGLHILQKINKERKWKRKKQMTYHDLQKEIESGKRSVDYDDINGGRIGNFISLLLGKKGVTHSLDKNRAEHVGDRIGRMLPAVKEPGWKASSERKFGNESVDSIVYEYIEKQDPKQAQRFLTLEKPKTEDRKDETLMANYRAEKERLQKYRGTCILHLDIVESIARKAKIDMLRLNSEKKIRKFYDLIKKIFLISCNGTATGSYEKYKEIIERVAGYYRATDFSTRDLKGTVKQFNDTLDILQARHINLFQKNKKGGSGTGTGGGALARPNYYSARDMKLFGRIEDALRSGAYVAFGTRKLSGKTTGLNRESEAGGMVGTHAYTIINTRKVKIGNDERLFVVVMNPWAEKGVVYDVEADGIKERAVRGEKDKENEEGVFCLELRRFAEVVSSWDSVPA